MPPLRCHDYHLRGYSVLDFGTRIVFDLSYDYPDNPDKAESCITFADVECYSFVHPSGAIITDIDELDVSTLVMEEAAFFTEAATRYGLRSWRERHWSLAEYVSTLQAGQFRAFRIYSALGFDGFVVAKNATGQYTEHSSAVS